MLKFSDLVKPAELPKSVIDVDDLGKVEITKLSSQEALDVLCEAVEITDKMKEMEFATKWACRLLKGEMGTEEELNSLRKSQTPAVLMSVYREGIAASIGTKEDHEKN